MRVVLSLPICLCLAGCIQLGPTAGTPAANDQATPTTSVASAPRIAPPPVTPPTPPGTNLPAFACANVGGGTTGVAAVTDVRISEQLGYDRFVLQFDGAVPAFTVKRQAKPIFVLSPSGQQVTLSGTAGVLVALRKATESSTYSGPTDLAHPEFPVLKEARLTQDFEGVVSWALGLGHSACLRAFTLTSPSRLVVDFSTTPA